MGISNIRGKVARLKRSLHEGQASPDDFWALARLTPAEGRVYLSLDARDREHACRVTQALLAQHPSAAADSALIAAALLHDCGKAVRPYRVHERVWAGLVPHKALPLLPFGAFGVRLHHPARGAALVRQAGGREEVAFLIARHHQPAGDPCAELLHRFDELE